MVANSVLGGVLGTMALVSSPRTWAPACSACWGTDGHHRHHEFPVRLRRGVRTRDAHEDLQRLFRSASGHIASHPARSSWRYAVVTFVLIELWKDGLVGGSMPSNRFMVDALIDSMYVFLVYYILLGICRSRRTRSTRSTPTPRSTSRRSWSSWCACRSSSTSPRPPWGPGRTPPRSSRPPTPQG